MDCILCKKPIRNYQTAFNHLKIDKSCEVDICSNCVDKFLKWQQNIFTNLFPTKAIKKRCGKKP